MNIRPPGGDRTWIAVLVLVCGAYLVGAGIVKHIAPLGTGGGALVLAGAGLWCGCTWARWLGTALFAGCALWFAWGLALRGLDFTTALGAAACAFFALEIWRQFRPATSS